MALAVSVDAGGPIEDAGRDAETKHAPPDGPHDVLLSPGRPIWYALPGEGAAPFRLVGHIHGICGPPSYACGKWIEAGTHVGAMICPTGNAMCGAAPSWEAPSWGELVDDMDKDLEASISIVTKRHPTTVIRDGAVLTGYSRGAYAAPVIAQKHPGRWPYLVLIEANVPLSSDALAKAGVKAVALVAGETGTEIAGERKTEAQLQKDAKVRAKLFVMPKTGHLYSDDMERVMTEALAFVLE